MCGYALALDANLLAQAVVEYHLDHARGRVPVGRCVRCVEVCPEDGHLHFLSSFPEISTEPIAKRSSQRSGSATSSARRPSCGPEAPCCSSRCSSGASWAPARRRPCRSVRHPRSPTGARASTRRRHPREKRPHSKRGPTDDSPGELTHHSHPSPSLTNFTGTPGTCARSSRPRRNPTARASWTPPTARHAAASPWRSARPTAR